MNEQQLKEIQNRCEAIPGDEDWWHWGNEQPFIDAAVEMVEAGFTIDHAIDILTRLYYTVADEFGA